MICCSVRILYTLLRVSTTLHNDIQATISFSFYMTLGRIFPILYSRLSICLPCLREAMSAFSISQTNIVRTINVPIPMLCLRCCCRYSCSVLAATNLSAQSPLLFTSNLQKISLTHSQLQPLQVNTNF